MRALPALVLLVATAASAQAPAPTAPGASPLAAGPARPPDLAPAAPKREADPKAATKPDEARPPDVRTVAGQIGTVDWGEHRFTLEAADGPLPVKVDRNTLVFLESRLGTVGDLQAGLPVRAGLEGPENLAAWVEVRPHGTAPAPGKPEPFGAGVGTSGGTPAGGSGSTGGRREPPTPSPIPPSTSSPGTPPGPGPVPGGTGGPR